MTGTVAEPRTDALRAALEPVLGPVRRLVPVGSGGGTFVAAAAVPAVAKRIRADRPAASLPALFAALAGAGVPCAPLLGTVRAGADEYALFGYVRGSAPDPASPEWAGVWSQAFALLPRLAEVDPAAAPWALEDEWLARLRGHALADPARAELHALLVEGTADGPPALAHGDFAAQNFLCTPAGLVLVDWEEAGTARRGFDAGWVLATNRVGAGPRMDRAALADALARCGAPEAGARWGEGLGLLRMAWRLDRWIAERPELAPLAHRVAAEVRAYLAEQPAGSAAGHPSNDTAWRS